jgi:hypothetical protein
MSSGVDPTAEHLQIPTFQQCERINDPILSRNDFQQTLEFFDSVRIVPGHRRW